MLCPVHSCISSGDLILSLADHSSSLAFHYQSSATHSACALLEVLTLSPDVLATGAARCSLWHRGVFRVYWPWRGGSAQRSSFGG